MDEIGKAASGSVYNILGSIDTAYKCCVPQKLRHDHGTAKSDLHDSIQRCHLQLIKREGIQLCIAAIHAKSDQPATYPGWS